MMCRHPYVKDPTGKCFSPFVTDGSPRDGVPFPCGQCLPCRINKRRVWTHRMILEASLWSDNAFVTLTYDEEHLPEGGILVKKHLQDYMKRLRRKLEPLKIRYYACGEYGTLTHRPHYHIIIFGYPPSNIYAKVWDFGHVEVGEVTPDSIQYVAGYVAKKIAYKFRDLVPEFALMSRRPGIGYQALEDVARLMEDPNFRSYLGLQGDVPAGLMHGRKFYPFGRFLKEKLRALCSLTFDPEPYYREIRDGYYAWLKSDDTHKFYKDYLVSLDDNKAKHQAARQKIFSRHTL